MSEGKNNNIEMALLHRQQDALDALRDSVEERRAALHTAVSGQRLLRPVLDSLSEQLKAVTEADFEAAIRYGETRARFIRCVMQNACAVLRGEARGAHRSAPPC